MPSPYETYSEHETKIQELYNSLIVEINKYKKRFNEITDDTIPGDDMASKVGLFKTQLTTFWTTQFTDLRYLSNDVENSNKQAIKDAKTENVKSDIVFKNFSKAKADFNKIKSIGLASAPRENRNREMLFSEYYIDTFYACVILGGTYHLYKYYKQLI
jgi:hypothetical protein